MLEGVFVCVWDTQIEPQSSNQTRVCVLPSTVPRVFPNNWNAISSKGLLNAYWHQILLSFDGTGSGGSRQKADHGLWPRQCGDALIFRRSCTNVRFFSGCWDLFSETDARWLVDFGGRSRGCNGQSYMGNQTCSSTQSRLSWFTVLLRLEQSDFTNDFTVKNSHHAWVY